MLVIRLQRTGRKGHAMFRVVVQDSRWTPSSGKVVARLGSYDPHTKTLHVDKDKAVFYLEHGAQPSERIARLLKADGVKLPDWVPASKGKESAIKNPDKRRSTRPEEPVEEKPAEEAPATEETAAKEEPAKEEAVAPAEAPETEASDESSEEASAEPEKAASEDKAEA